MRTGSHLADAGGKPVRAMVRKTSDQARISKLKELGVQIVEGDLRDSSTFEPASEAVDAVITTVSSIPFSYVPGENDIETVDLEGMKNLINAARSAEAGHFVYTSFLRNADISFPLRNARRAVEQHLRETGMG